MRSIYLRKQQLRKKIVWITLTGTISFLTVYFLVMFVAFTIKLPTQEQTPVIEQTDFDGIAVFSGGQYRIGTAALIIKDGFKGPVLISGVFPEINQNVKLFKSLGLTEEQISKITFDHESLTTIDNAKKTKEWGKSNNLSKILVITSYYHIPRSQLLLSRSNKEKIEFIFYPVFSNNTDFNILFKEYVKYLLFNINYIISIQENQLIAKQD